MSAAVARQAVFAALAAAAFAMATLGADVAVHVLSPLGSALDWRAVAAAHLRSAVATPAGTLVQAAPFFVAAAIAADAARHVSERTALALYIGTAVGLQAVYVDGYFAAHVYRTHQAWASADLALQANPAKAASIVLLCAAVRVAIALHAAARRRAARGGVAQATDSTASGTPPAL